ncbi:MAG: murein biosynthesis integral membrane protein MurJ [bacterium]
MVKKILNIFSKEIVSVHGVAYLLGFFALLAQLLALVRDRMLAADFGAGTTLDIYYASFRIPDLIFVTVASLVSISILVPFFTEVDEEGKDTKALMDGIFSIFFAIMIVVSALAFIFMPFLAVKFFPGLTDGEIEKLITLSRIMLLSPLFLGFSNFFASIVQMYNRFFLYALSPILYNVGIIFGIIFLYPIFGIYGLGFGVGIGAFLHAFVQVPFIIHKKTFPKITTKIDFPSVKRIITLSIPRTVTLSTNSISAFALISMASLLGAGAITIFNFSFNLESGPLSIIGVSYASAVFPMLSRLHVQGNKKAFLERMISVTKHIIFWSMPIIVLFVVLRAQIVRTVLGAGHFTWSDTRLTAAALALFSISVIPQSLVLLFVRAFYAEGKTKKPLLINVIAMVATIACGYLFVFLYKTFPTIAYFFQNILRIEDVPGSSVVMLALAFSVGITFNMILHWVAFEKEFSGYTKNIWKVSYQSLSASVIIGYVSYLCLNIFDDFLNLETLVGIFLQGLLAGIAGLIAGVIVLKLMKSEELDQVISSIRKKIWKEEKNKNIIVDELI